MKIVHITELVYAEPRPTTVEEKKIKHDGILASLELPIYLGTATAVNYDMKADRYAITFIPTSEKKLVLKATDEVAAFISVTGLDNGGYWMGRMEEGTLVDASLIKA